MLQPQQLNIECTIGALKLTKQGSLSSLVARYRMPENNQASTFSANYEAKANSNYSKNFKTISKGSGGVLPRLNLSIGAPMATFIEQSILTNADHGVYTLLRGAKKSNFDESTYSCTGSNQAEASEGGQPPPEGINFSSYFNQGNSGYIPLKSNEIASETSIKETWNIWKQITNQDLAKKIIPALGVINYEALGVPHAETAVGPLIPGITVNAANSISLLERIFPVSDDLAYNSHKIYFSRPGGGTPIQKTIQAKGGVNCGFWLRFKNLTDFTFYKSLNSVNKSTIRLAFGNFKTTYPDKISQFAIIISENSTILRFLNPVTKAFESINLNNKASINSGILDVFIHFAGPNMFVGFDKEISNWNVFEPQTFGSDETKFYEPFIDDKAKIQVLIENFNCTFTYSPICFDSFDPDAILTSTSGYSNPDGNSTMNIRFDVNSNNSAALESCAEDKINSNLISKSSPRLSSDNQNFLSKPQEGPTYYSDWRRINKGQNDSKKTLDEYKTNPELKYFQSDKYESKSKSNDPRTYFIGRIRYETTIEGPIFFYARNFKDDDILNTPNKMVHQIWGKYSDISKYFESASITESFKNKNISYKESTATINLINMTNDNIGRQILNAIQENVLVVTLKCGHDDENKSTFFQGIIVKVQVDRASDNFKTILTCQDLGDYLLDNIRFPNLSEFPLGFRTYKGLLEDVFELGGLLEYYKPRPRLNNSTFDVLHDYYLTRYQGDPIYQLSLTNKLPTVNVKNKIKQIVLETLQHLIYTSDKSGYFNSSLPVFRWDAEKEQFTLSLRGDFEVEELWLAGEPSDEQLLANSNESIHGIVQGGSEGWSETSEIDNLHSEIWMIARRFDGEMITEQSNASFINRAISEESFTKLDNLVTDGINLTQENLGYVGFNKIFYADEATANSLFRTKQLARKLFDSYEHASRFTYQELKLNVYVTKPLITHGRFEVKSFKDSGFIDFSGEYNYSSVTYSILANENLIRANITANYFPRVL